MPRKFRGLGGSYYLVRHRDVARSRDEAQVLAFLQRAKRRHPPGSAEAEEEERELAALAKAIAEGSMVLVRTSERPPLMDAPKVRPLVEQPSAPSEVKESRPTWLSIELVHENGAAMGVVPVELGTPDGDTRSETIGRDGRWRADDITGRGDCRVKLGAAITADPGGGKPVELRAEDAWIGPNAGDSTRLVTEAHHRVVVVGGSTTVELRDLEDQPVEGERCVVRFETRELVGVTDRLGRFVAAHPVGETVCEISFPNLDESACEMEGQG